MVCDCLRQVLISYRNGVTCRGSRGTIILATLLHGGRRGTGHPIPLSAVAGSQPGPRHLLPGGGIGGERFRSRTGDDAGHHAADFLSASNSSRRERRFRKRADPSRRTRAPAHSWRTARPRRQGGGAHSGFPGRKHAQLCGALTGTKPGFKRNCLLGGFGNDGTARTYARPSVLGGGLCQKSWPRILHPQSALAVCAGNCF